ncbi:MAG: hypothetical protein ACKOA9_07920 [Actinomycetota bacterium]
MTALSGRAVWAVVLRPALWTTALRQSRRLARSGWWRRAPFLPAPDPGYLRFRMEAQYGSPTQRPRPADLLTYLELCRAQETDTRRRARAARR